MTTENVNTVMELSFFRGNVTEFLWVKSKVTACESVELQSRRGLLGKLIHWYTL